jgi:hypothetical protein
MQVFTAYVRSLTDRAPHPTEVTRLWVALRGALRAELKRRGLWELPPQYLGIVGWRHWGAAGGGEEDPRGVPRETAPLPGLPPGGGALDELTADCYAFVFVDRLRSLQAQLLLKPDVEGLVLLDIRHFLHERQRQHDPLGFRIFEIARAAVREALALGELHVLRGDPRVRNGTVIGWSPDPAPAAPAAPAPPADLGSKVARWSDELTPDLVTAQGSARHEVTRKLLQRLLELRGEGIATWRFGDLAGALKQAVRGRWAAVLGQAAREIERGDAGGDRGGAAEPEHPGAELERREELDQLNGRVRAALSRLPTDARTRRYLSRLWDYLAQQANGPDEPAGSRQQARATGTRPIPSATDRASHRKIERQLGIPRARLPELLATLERLAETCRAVDSRRTGPRAQRNE